MAPRAALFGKLPAHGDFVVRGLDAAAASLWDTMASGWVAGHIEAGREVFAGPDLHFLSGPGALGPGWRAGTMGPSRDRAGRDFVAVLMVDGLDASEACAFAPLICRDSADIIRHAATELLGADATRDLMDEVWQGYDTALPAVLAPFRAVPEPGFSCWWSPSTGTVVSAVMPPQPTALTGS